MQDTIDRKKDIKLTLIPGGISKGKFKKIIKVDDENKFDLYVDLKGIDCYVQITNSLLKKDYAIKDINFEVLDSIFKYDKKIRLVFFEFISAFEERIRAYFLNNFRLVISLKNKVGIKVLLSKKTESNESLFIALEESSFSELIKYVNDLPQKNKKELFCEAKLDHLTTSLWAMVSFRNAVYHSKMLFLRDDWTKCWIKKKKLKTLEANIQNFYNLLDSRFKSKFLEEFNECKNDKKNVEFLKIIDEFYPLKVN